MKMTYWRTASVVTMVLTIIALGALAAPQRGPSTSQQELVQAWQQLGRDVANLQQLLQQEERYTCCIKPGCTFCTVALGSCPCAARLQQGQGVCPECFGGWHCGQGALGEPEDLTATSDPHGGADRLSFKGEMIKIAPRSLLQAWYQQRSRVLGGEPPQPNQPPPGQQPQQQ